MYICAYIYIYTYIHIHVYVMYAYIHRCVCFLRRAPFLPPSASPLPPLPFRLSKK